jgi:Undecaprenyl-phosphate glucose phosphotransferase
MARRRGDRIALRHSLEEIVMYSPAHPDLTPRSRQFGLPVRVFDAVVIVLGALLAAQYARVVTERGFESAVLAFALLFALVCFPSLGMYRFARRHLLWRCVCLPVVSWLAVLAASVLLVATLHHTYRPEPAWVGLWAVVSTLGIVACRLAGRGLSLHRARRHAHTRAVAVVGSGDLCRHLIGKVDRADDSPYRVAAIFETSPEREARPGGPSVFRDGGEFAAYVRRRQIDEVWLALPLSQEQVILDFTTLFRNDLIDIRFIPDVSDLALFEGGMVDLDGTSAIDLVGSPLSSQAFAKKEIFDRLFAFFAVLGLLPVLLVIACAVKLSSRGPVLFKQRRKGANGKVFAIYKFRSMRVHAESEGIVRQATRNDSRVTRVGAFLRRTSLDELPQFFNVLRGEMSVVGPRPHAIEHDALYQNIVDGYIHRYRIKPGITGWAQVNGFRGETDCVEKMRRRVEHDLYYLSNWSFALDIRIVLMTFAKGLVHRNAY